MSVAPDNVSPTVIIQTLILIIEIWKGKIEISKHKTLIE
jgi:hypothetical protein